MNIRPADIEQFLRKEVDSSIRVQRIIGLDLGAKGVAFQYQSAEQTVWVVLEYATAASLILGPSYAPLQAVEAIVARETFQDDELENSAVCALAVVTVKCGCRFGARGCQVLFFRRADTGHLG